MNSIFKYIYIVIIVVIVAELIYLIYKLNQLKKELDKLNINIEDINNNLDDVKAKLEVIKSTKDSWTFFLSLYLTLSLVSLIKKDYKKTKKDDRSLSKSIAKVCVKNITTINKLRTMKL